MQKSFILVSLIISLMVISCVPKQKSELPQTVTLTTTATKTAFPSLINTPIITPTSIEKSNGVYNMSVSPDGKMVAITRGNGIEVYDLTNGSLVYSFDVDNFEGHHLYSYIAWSPNGKFLATGRPSSGINIWNTNNWTVLTEVQDPQDNGYQVSGFEWSPDSNQLALGMRDGTIRTWDSKESTWTTQENCITGLVFGLTWMTNNDLQIFTNSGIYSTSSCQKVRDTEYGMDGCCGYAVVSPDKRNIFLFFDLGGSILNVENSEYVFGICCYPAIAWSMDGRYFAAVSKDSNTITTLDTLDRSSYVFPIGIIQALAWSLDNELLALSVRDSKKEIWSTSTGRTLVTLK
jgi:WD40 repeat protein